MISERGRRSFPNYGLWDLIQTRIEILGNAVSRFGRRPTWIIQLCWKGESRTIWNRDSGRSLNFVKTSYLTKDKCVRLNTKWIEKKWGKSKSVTNK